MSVGTSRQSASLPPALPSWSTPAPVSTPSPSKKRRASSALLRILREWRRWWREKVLLLLPIPAAAQPSPIASAHHRGLAGAVLNIVWVETSERNRKISLVAEKRKAARGAAVASSRLFALGCGTVSTPPASRVLPAARQAYTQERSIASSRTQLHFRSCLEQRRHSISLLPRPRRRTPGPLRRRRRVQSIHERSHELRLGNERRRRRRRQQSSDTVSARGEDVKMQRRTTPRLALVEAHRELILRGHARAVGAGERAGAEAAAAPDRVRRELPLPEAVADGHEGLRRCAEGVRDGCASAAAHLALTRGGGRQPQEPLLLPGPH